MRDIIDLHTHTIASGHAYNTINEMVVAAAGKKLEILGITEHAPALPGTCTAMYFQNLKTLPRTKLGLSVWYGAEVNICDFEGHVDLSDEILDELDLVIASMHCPCYQSGSRTENTRAYLRAMEHPCINIIGHPDDGRFPVDYKALAEGAREHGVLLELNNSSLAPNSFREAAKENCRKMLEQCIQYETPVIINSDAHVDLDVGNHELAMAIVEELDFPEKLLVNAHPEQLKKYINYLKR